jgi:FHA domain-containing protein
MLANMPTPAFQPAPKPLSPSLMADMVEIGNVPVAPALQAADTSLDALSVMKARREQRKAVLLEKTKTGLGPMPAVPPLSNPAPAARMPVQTSQQMAVPAGLPMTATNMPARQQGSAGSADDALAALFQGMGFPNADLPQDDSGEVLREVGALVRETAAGLVSLLAARKMVKSEFRMDETQIQPRENNPFKFFQVAELALDELFVSRRGGYQEPAEAARSAFKDIEQHTMLLMSATQRAIKLLFERLSPDAMGESDDGGLRIRGLAGRKGKWETYVETHGRMSRDSDSIARQIISEAFSQIQEEQARKGAKDRWGQR